MSVDLNERMLRSLRMNEQPSISSLPSPTKDSNVKKPLINVLPSSKLLSRNLLHLKNLRKRRVSTRLTQSTKINQGRSNRLLNSSNFSTNSKIHTQISSNNAQHSLPNSSHPPQFAQRPPINLFKLRMPFPPHIQQRIHIQHQQPPEDDSNLNLLPPSNPLLPPSVVLVPYPVALPIILPIPLPLTAFLKAYQTKGCSEISSNDNDSHGEEQVTKGVRIYENEQPLDLSSEQGGFCETDKNFIINKSHNNNNNGEAAIDSEVKKSVSDNDVMSVRKMQHHVIKDDVSCENNRPLRKRKIIELGKSQ
jgi:hypothetical protein